VVVYQVNSVWITCFLVFMPIPSLMQNDDGSHRENDLRKAEGEDLSAIRNCPRRLRQY